MGRGCFVRIPYVILSSVWHLRLFVLSVMMQKHPLWMPLNDVKEDSDSIKAGEEASSLSRHAHSKTMSTTRDSRWELGSEGKGIGGQGLEMLWTDNRKGDSGTHLFGEQGDEVSLKLRLDHLHHMLDLCGLTAVNQLIQRQQLLWASPALQQNRIKKLVSKNYMLYIKSWL